MQLDPEVRRDLRGLRKEIADVVSKHLVAAGSLLEDDPALALSHARYARSRAARLAVVREAAGIAAYHAGEWAEAIAELRAARRMGGGPGHLAVMADAERALGRPERALELARGPEAHDLDRAEAIELLIVASGARRDLGELDAAVVSLQIPELNASSRAAWSPRLFYAYADALLAADRREDAVRWFLNAAEADQDELTDATDRLAELAGDADRSSSTRDDHVTADQDRASRTATTSVAEESTDADEVGGGDSVSAVRDVSAGERSTPGTDVAEPETPVERRSELAAEVDTDGDTEVDTEVDTEHAAEVDTEVEVRPGAGGPERIDTDS